MGRAAIHLQGQAGCSTGVRCSLCRVPDESSVHSGEPDMPLEAVVPRAAGSITAGATWAAPMLRRLVRT